MNRIIRIGLLSSLFGCLLLSLVILLLNLRNYPGYVSVAAWIAFAAGVVFPILNRRLFIFLLITYSSILPFFSPSTLLLGVIGLLLGSSFSFRSVSSSISKLDLAALTTLIALPLFSLVKSCLIELDTFLAISFIVHNLDILGYLSFVELEDRHLIQGAIDVIGVVVMVATAVQIRKAVLTETNYIQQIYYGVVVSALYVATFAFLQIGSIYPELSKNQGAFWIYSSRFPASFTDPNSFGVMTALYTLLATVIITTVESRKGKIVMTGSILLLLLSALWSGSRTLFLGVFLVLVVGCGYYIKCSRHSKAIAAIVVLLLLMLPIPIINDSLQRIFSAPGSVRVLQSINAETFLKMLESRQIFGSIAIEMWKEEPITGVGHSRFYGKQVAVAQSLAKDLGNWRDNANNFYLQVLAEQGVVGLLLLLLAGAALLRKRTSTISNYARTGLLAFSILLITGPHLLFSEVKITAGVFLGLALSGEKDAKFSKVESTLYLLFFTLLFILYLPAKQQIDRGIYAVEDSVTGRYFWSSTTGEIIYRERSGNPQDDKLRVRAVRASSNDYPVVVDFEFYDSVDRLLGEASYRLANDNWTEVKLEKVDLLYKISFKVDKSWKPPGENRHLGVIFDNSFRE